MTEDDWERIAGRIASTWPAVPEGAGSYREALAGLDADDVGAAIDAMMFEHRTEPPDPGRLRERALEEAAYGGDPPVPIEHVPDDDARPRPSVLSGRPESGVATAAVIFGVVGIVALPIVGSLVAIRLADRALREIAADPALGGAERARLGRVLGWVGIGVFATAVAIGLAFGIAGG